MPLTYVPGTGFILPLSDLDNPQWQRLSQQAALVGLSLPQWIVVLLTAIVDRQPGRSDTGRSLERTASARPAGGTG